MNFVGSAISQVLRFRGSKRIAFVLLAGTFPPLFGFGLATVYRASHVDGILWLAVVGGLGCFLLVISGLALLTIKVLRRNSSVYKLPAFWFALAVLFLNFPAAAVIANHITATASRVNVGVTNSSASWLTEITIHFRGTSQSFPDIPPASSRRVVYYPSSGPDSSVTLRAKLGRTPVAEDGGVYATNGMETMVELKF